MKKHLLLILGIIPSIAFSQTIGAFIAPGEFREFMSHNLGADTNLDPLSLSQGIHGAKYQWGNKNPILTQAQDQANSGSIVGWNTTPALDNSWMDGTKTANDPCPDGFRVPTTIEWQGVIDNNTKTYIGSWTSGPDNYDSGIKFGDFLLLPASGQRLSTFGQLDLRGGNGNYWSSSIGSSIYDAYYLNFANSLTQIIHRRRSHGNSVRCIKELPILSTQDINKNKSLGIFLYPNPANSEFSITQTGASKKGLGKVKVEVYDLLGKLLLKEEDKEKVSVNSLSNGVYLVKISTADGKTQTEKLVIEK
ncbi:T9SS type A sorting domain-containing protein [Chryseobacterium sp.]|uniref:T9SS type A sorting domain-containing protein n=1 Tax=Chryseobacterium sp. TaxID=1871047 RepID=UPI0035AE0F86